jgi:hypothetical protein
MLMGVSRAAWNLESSSHEPVKGFSHFQPEIGRSGTVLPSVLDMLRSRHTLTQALSLALFAFAAVTACSSVRADDDPAAGDDDGDGPNDPPVGCGDIGEPCATESEVCAFASYDCDQINHVCKGGSWAMDDGSVVSLASCPEEAPAAGSACDPYVSMCVGSCHYDVGDAHCLGWWAYPQAPASDCTKHASGEECSADAACMWAQDCDSGAPRCLPSVPCIGEGTQCPPGLACAPVSIDDDDVVHGTCEFPATVSFCLPL